LGLFGFSDDVLNRAPVAGLVLKPLRVMKVGAGWGNKIQCFLQPPNPGIRGGDFAFELAGE